jgi:cytochrome b pre-mRNA-processing protein 3
MTDREQAKPGWIRSWKARRHRRELAHELYVQLVAQARDPVLYRDWGVPDTVDGRLEMISLHAALLMGRLAAADPQGQELAQAFFDVMFGDVDRNLRELGVGDLSVGKKVKAIAESFYARAAALQQALVANDREAIAIVLTRNVYVAGPSPETGQLDGLITHLFMYAKHLEALPESELLSGRLSPASRNVDLASPGT